MLKTAIAYHQRGQMAEAKRMYEDILAREPQHVVALHLRGVVALQEGCVEEAIALISRSLVRQPDYAEAHYHMGRAQKLAGNFSAAIVSFRKAITIKPDYVQALCNLADALQVTGDMDETIASYRKAIAVMPDYAVAHNNLGIALMGEKRVAEALESFRAALEVDPDYGDAHYNLGNALMDLKQFDKAIECYQRVVSRQSDNAYVHNNLGEAHRQVGERTAAVASFRRAINLQPDYAIAHNNLGNALSELGRIDEAIASFGEAIALDPDFAEAHRVRSLIKKHSAYDNDIKRMEAVLAKPGTDEEKKVHLAFGLGKAFEDIGDYDKAFEYFSQGNALKRAQYDYSLDHLTAHCELLKATFNEVFTAKHESGGCADSTPIFVLGMPRSGTTLIEQILASHSQVYGAGELADLPRLIGEQFGPLDSPEFGAAVRQAEPYDFEHLGADFVASLRHHSSQAKFITDKSPSNFLYIGFIRLSLPNAKIIHSMRDPVDTCLSLFKSFFTSSEHYHAYDLREIAGYYRLYRDLMTHWRGLFPDFIQDMRYEDVVAEQEASTRRILSYCDLDWEDACLAFYETERSINTLSMTQVRKPMYQTSVQSWKRYGTRLAELLTLLKGEDEQTS